jgi:hypothetical protein
VSGGKKSQQSCPKQKGTIAVVFVRSDIGKPIQGATVAVQGPTPGSGTTDNLGAVVLKDRTPGPYTARVTLPASMKSYGMTLETTKGSVSAGGSEILLFKAAPVGNLLIEVYDNRDKLVTEEATLSASGAAGLSKTGKTGTHAFTGIPCGAYEVSASVPSALFEAPIVSQKGVFVAEGATQKVQLKVKRLANVVTPKIEMEYKVVLLDRKLSAHQEGSEKKIVADDVTCVRVSASQSTGTPAYKGEGKLEVSPANVELYTDKDCRNKLAGKIKNAELLGGKLDLYLKSRTKGKFKAKLTLDPANDPDIELKGPAEEEMGVVELESALHRFEKADLDALEMDKALPAQKAMTDADKVKLGRLLHVQDSGHHGRAKLVVKKLAAGDWPADTDAYDVVIECEKGSLKLFDKEAAGAEKALPFKTKVKDLKAKDLELWVEGKSESDAARDAVLGIGLDRGAGGLAHKPKKHGDWGRFTVVKIAKVELVVSVPAGKPKVWDAAKKRYYINTEAAPAGRTLGDSAGNREVKVVASLGKAIKDVPIHFMLAPHKDNAAPAGLPGTWKQEELKVALRALDRKDRKALMHLSAPAGADGKAEMKKLVLSQFGGDKFTPAAYIEQDAHLSKYVPDHADLGKRKPALCADTLQVWKRFDYKMLYMKRHDGTSYSERFAEADLQAKFAADFIEMERVGAVVTEAHKDMVGYDDARNWVIGKLGAEKPRQLQFAFVDAIGKAPELDHEMTLAPGGLPGLSFTWRVPGGECFDMSAQGKWLKSAECGEAGSEQAIPFDRIALLNDGPNHKLTVDLRNLPFLAGVDLADIGVKIVLKKHDGPSGLSWGAPTLVAMRWRESLYVGQENEAASRTAYHEAGHYMSLAPKFLPDTADGASTLWYDSPGVGDHCKFGPEECTMWHEFRMKINFCPTCKLALRARDHSSNVAAAGKF